MAGSCALLRTLAAPPAPAPARLLTFAKRPERTRQTRSYQPGRAHFSRAIAESGKSDALAERLQLLSEHFTFFLFQNVCRWGHGGCSHRACFAQL